MKILNISYSIFLLFKEINLSFSLIEQLNQFFFIDLCKSFLYQLMSTSKEEITMNGQMNNHRKLATSN